MLIILYVFGFISIYAVTFVAMALDWPSKVVTLCILASFAWVAVGFGLLFTHPK